MPETYPTIDYEEMISSIEEDLSSNYISENDSLLIVRQKTEVICEAYGGSVRPVLDYFYESPALINDIKEYTVKECKKICFDAVERLTDENLAPLKDAVAMNIDELMHYSKGNPKRNERKCKVVFEEKYEAPIMVYFDDNDAGDAIEKISVSDLLSELKSCQE